MVFAKESAYKKYLQNLNCKTAKKLCTLLNKQILLKGRSAARGSNKFMTILHKIQITTL